MFTDSDCTNASSNKSSSATWVQNIARKFTYKTRFFFQWQQTYKINARSQMFNIVFQIWAQQLNFLKPVAVNLIPLRNINFKLESMTWASWSSKYAQWEFYSSVCSHGVQSFVSSKHSLYLPFRIIQRRFSVTLSSRKRYIFTKK